MYMHTRRHIREHLLAHRVSAACMHAVDKDHACFLSHETSGCVCSLLDAELVQEALNELTRLMPNSDPKRTLLRDPSVVLRVERGPKRLGPHPDS